MINRDKDIFSRLEKAKKTKKETNNVKNQAMMEMHQYDYLKFYGLFYMRILRLLTSKNIRMLLNLKNFDLEKEMREVIKFN